MLFSMPGVDSAATNTTQNQMTSDGTPTTEADLVCCICLDLFCKPVTLSDCGHSFCCLCIFKEIKHRVSHQQLAFCSTCRKQINSHPSAPSVTIENMVRTHLLTKTEEEQRQEKERTNAIHEELFDLLTGENLSRGEIWAWFNPVKAIFDLHDRVFRCPICIWEVDDNGICANDVCRRQWTIDRSILDNMDESASDASDMSFEEEDSEDSEDSDVSSGSDTIE